ncbi:MAG: nucleoside-diphosphate sugar epimerase/dehydratase [Candidatus Omnitrophica bacterium]|nr:nucleoside-diphosphate sugar epimerase/dehydratase [Candidatus Omnitrophota bacterium]HOX54456.1 nucleoside-diphosphate sugar epimerase/dehydratase [Candidatus Omnitrophota bacterium]
MGIIKKNLRKKKIAVLVVGAGAAGNLVLDEIKRHGSLNYKIIGFVDDDPKKQNKCINGICVLGKIQQIPKIVKANKIKEIIIAIPSASGMQNKRIVNKCEEAKVTFRIIPGIYEMLKHDTAAGLLREVELEDLIRRKPIDFDSESIKSYITNKTIFVSGAGGSIGRELCLQILKFYPRKLILFDHEENSLNDVFSELRNSFSNIDVVPIVGNICERNKIKRLFVQFKPDVVFHSAAYKHVPMMEFNVAECIKNNVFGTLNMVEEARAGNVKRFVFISSDKALKPASIMGASKNIGEMIVKDASRNSRTNFSIVRFGNVLISRGSVVPLFVKQIKERQAITITHRKMTRYFMTLPEAAQLVIQAGALSKGGEIFVLDMGKPIKIIDLAKDMIRLSGLRPYKDIPIVYVGMRPGERLNEPHFEFSKKLQPSDHERILLAAPILVNHKRLFSSLGKLRTLVFFEDKNKIVKEIKKIVPSFKEASYGRKTSDSRWQAS